MQAPDAAKARIQHTYRLIEDSAASCRLQLKRLQRAVEGHPDSLQYIFSQAAAASGSCTGLRQAAASNVEQSSTQVSRAVDRDSTLHEQA